MQQDIGWNTVMSVGYVGTLSRHQQELLNLNYSPYGELFTKAAQDPSKYAGGIVPDEEPNLPQVYRDAGVKFTGQFALPAAFLKKYPGLRHGRPATFGGSSNYHSLQSTVSKRLGQLAQLRSGLYLVEGDGHSQYLHRLHQPGLLALCRLSASGL